MPLKNKIPVSNEIAGASRCWLCSTSTLVLLGADRASALAPAGSTTVRPGAAEEISTKIPNRRWPVVVGARSLCDWELYVWKMWGIFSYWILPLTSHDWLTDEACQAGKEDRAHGKWRTCELPTRPKNVVGRLEMHLFLLLWLDLETSLWGCSFL
jgi:hypothetical protein